MLLPTVAKPSPDYSFVLLTNPLSVLVFLFEREKKIKSLEITLSTLPPPLKLL